MKLAKTEKNLQQIKQIIIVFGLCTTSRFEKKLKKISNNNKNKHKNKILEKIYL